MASMRSSRTLTTLQQSSQAVLRPAARQRIRCLSQLPRSQHPQAQQPLLRRHTKPSASTPSQPTRTFVSSPFSSNNDIQTLTATRTLSYPSKAIYSIIADVASYQQFLPYCLSSRVTKWSSPDSEGHKWPSEAEMVVGWGQIQETFSSKIYCVPGRIVEAVGGASKTTLKDEDIAHHREAGPAAGEGEERTSPAPSSGDHILTHLLTRWTVRPFPYKPPPMSLQPGENPQTASVEHKHALPTKEQTEVALAIEFAFANPLYATMSKAVAGKVAGVMIEAFERRVGEVMDRPSSNANSGQGKGREGGSKLEGVLPTGKP